LTECHGSNGVVRENEQVGIASLLLCIGSYQLSQYNYSLRTSGTPLFSTTTDHTINFFAQFVALVCAIVAARRGSKWWLVLVPPTLWFVFISYLGDL
jgi:hypothetical protein